MSDTCPQCGEGYKNVSQHWNYSSCERPSFTHHQREIITGLLMGDGNIDRGRGRKPRLRAKMVSPNYLEYLHMEFGILSTEVRLSNTAEEMRENARSTNSVVSEHHNLSDVYSWSTVRHPELQEFSGWYSSGEKVWPESIELTPTVLKHWYCGDGNWSNNGSHNYIQISMKNEEQNTDKADNMFNSVGLPSPSTYNTSGGGCEALFTVEQSQQLWEYMGEPLPDFEYKWPEQYRNTYPDSDPI